MKLIGSTGKTSGGKGHKVADGNNADKEFKAVKPELLQIYDELKDRLKDVDDTSN